MLHIMRFDLRQLNNIEFKPSNDQPVLEIMKKIYPDANEEELRAGLEALKNYLRVALKIVARRMREEAAALTVTPKIPTIQKQRSNPIHTNKLFNNL
jgi:hypothetical protein